MRSPVEAARRNDKSWNDGKPRLTATLPDRGALDGLAQTLAKLLAASGARIAVHFFFGERALLLAEPARGGRS